MTEREIDALIRLLRENIQYPLSQVCLSAIVELRRQRGTLLLNQNLQIKKEKEPEDSQEPMESPDPEFDF